MIDTIKNVYFNFLTSYDKDLFNKIILTVFIFILSWAFKKFANHLIIKNIEEKNASFTVKRIIHYIITIFSLIFVGSIWIVDFSKIGTFFGLFSAGIAISLKDLFINIAGWLYIYIRRPFNIGDRIEVDNCAGDVIDIRLFKFSILEIRNWIDADQSTGRIIDIPNSFVFTNKQFNFNKGFDHIWNEVKILITFESNWQKAKDILTDIITTQNKSVVDNVKKELSIASKKHVIMYANTNPIIYTSIKDSGVLLTIRYLCKPRARRNSEHLLYEKILEEFSRHKDIDFAYPTNRFFTS